MTDLVVILTAANEADTRAMIALSCMIPFAVLMFGVIEMVSRFKKRKNKKTVSIEIPAEYDLPVWKFNRGDLIKRDNRPYYFEVVAGIVADIQHPEWCTMKYKLISMDLKTRKYFHGTRERSVYHFDKKYVEKYYRAGRFKNES